MAKIQVFIATYNRPHLVVRALASAVSQDFDDYEVVISDNSTDDETERILAGYHHPKVNYIRRNPSLLGVDHFNTILNEVRADYFTVFHDDDEMHSNFLKVLFRKISSDSNIVAVGANATIKTSSGRKKGIFNPCKQDQLVRKKDDLVVKYLEGKGYAPFPGYLYKRIIAEKVRIDDSKIGKYADVLFLLSLLSFGKILLVHEELMNYYVHPGQDSQKNDFLSKMNLVYYVARETKLRMHDAPVRKYRLTNLYDEIYISLNARNYVSPKRCFLILFLMLKNGQHELFLKMLFHYFVYILKKLNPFKNVIKDLKLRNGHVAS
jgi:glycosyltransferase involved in cell wall biosynthesis